MITVLKYKTAKGNKLSLKNAPFTLGIEMLILACNESELADVQVAIDKKKKSLDES